MHWAHRVFVEGEAETMELGFCGAGLMGAPMIRHLLKAGHPVWVWNRSRAKAHALAEHGAHIVDTPRDLVSHTQAVLLCLTDTHAVEEVVFGLGGLLGEDTSDSGAGRVRWIVDHSSIGPAATRGFAARAAALDVGWIDAPVSGGVPGAQAGTLAAMAGGRADDVIALEPVIRAYAARVTHMGDVGAGQMTKLCNQAIVCATVAGIAEAVGLAQAAGIDASRLPEALAGGWADSVLLRTFVPRMTEPGLAPIGSLKTFQKDIDTVADAARATGAAIPVVGAVQQVLRLGAAMGLGDADLAAFIDIVRPQAGVAGKRR
jgi:2-hydroxy-3-oxopropionate reductase